MFKNSAIFRNNTPVSTNIIIINTLVWGACILLQRKGLNLYDLLGLHFVTASDFKLFQFFTYMFMHDTSSIAHLFFNMFAVFMFGRIIESTWGSARFLTFYLITGLGAGIIQQLAWWFDLREILSSSIELVRFADGNTLAVADYLNLHVTVGASGAVFGILLAFGMMFPNVPLYILFIPIPIKAKYVVIGYGLFELGAGVANFSFDNIAHFAHLGGMLFGFILIKIWQRRAAR